MDSGRVHGGGVDSVGIGFMVWTEWERLGELLFFMPISITISITPLACVSLHIEHSILCIIWPGA